jgi:two-component system response regulator
MNSNEIELLLVEDNPNDAEMTIRAMKRHNLANRLIHVGNGEEALDFLFCTGKFIDRDIRQQPKLVLLDLKMPKVDGIEVLTKIKNNELTRKIPIVVLTSSKEDPDIEECYRLGVNSYVVKPVEFDSFMKAVSEMGMYWMLLNQPPMH